MDPDANLAMIASALRARDMTEAVELKGYLLTWIQRGGYQPNWKKYPAAAKFVMTAHKQPWPKLAEIVAELKWANKQVEASKVNPSEDWTEVRLQVMDDGEWILHIGLSDYDQDHRGYWGASHVPGGGRRFNATAVARDLLEQAKEHHAQGED